MKILLHVPHSSLRVPKYFHKGLTISKNEFNKYNLEMTDFGIDELFKELEGVKIQAKYSRLFCDVERFKDDNLETMSKYGEGVIYTKTYDGKTFHKHDKNYRKKVLKYYDKYHNKLNKTAKKLLKSGDKLLILDLHSFSDKMASHFFEPPFPDVCIGVEEKYYDQKIIDKITNFLDSKNLTWKINYPYSGSLVPNAIYNGKLKGNIVSIMLEVNKRIYL